MAEYRYYACLNEPDCLATFIDIYGEDITLGELRDALREKGARIGE